MTDKELLEFAAKAAGIELQWESDGTIQNRMTRPTTPYSCQGLLSAVEWNPLTDDGDALRLAVKLGLLGAPEHVVDFVSALGDSDPYAAIRRAIVVCAAAEIWKDG